MRITKSRPGLGFGKFSRAFEGLVDIAQGLLKELARSLPKACRSRAVDRPPGAITELQYGGFDPVDSALLISIEYGGR
jgi:hypothetical protein